MFSFECIKMNEILNRFLVVADKCMPEMHLKQPDFTYSACGHSIKTKKELALVFNKTWPTANPKNEQKELNQIKF